MHLGLDGLSEKKSFELVPISNKIDVFQCCHYVKQSANDYSFQPYICMFLHFSEEIGKV